jgi:hypothetical protein
VELRQEAYCYKLKRLDRRLSQTMQANRRTRIKENEWLPVST